MFSFEDMRIRYSRSPRLRGLKREFKEEWEKRDIPPKPTRKGVWRLADEGKCWKDISNNAADIPDMIVPFKWTPPLRVSRACHDKAVQVTEMETKEKADEEILEEVEHCILNLYPTLPPATAVLYRHPPLGDPLIPVILAPSQTSHTGLPTLFSTTGLHTHSSVTGQPTVSSAICLQTHSSARGLPTLSSATGPQTHPGSVTGQPAMSSATCLQPHFTVTGLPAVSSTFGLQSHSGVTSLLEIFSTTTHQSHSTNFLAESSTIGLYSHSSVTGRPASPRTTDLPLDSWNYTIEGLRIPRIEQSLRGPSAGQLNTRSLEQCTGTSEERQIEALPRLPSTQNWSTDVNALEQVPTSEPSAQCSSTGHFVTKPASKEIATEVPSADVTKPEEGPSTSQPLRKRVREDDSVFPMPPKRYLNTHDVPSVKCVQTGIERKAHDEAPSEDAVTKRSSRMIKVPRRMDL